MIETGIDPNAILMVTFTKAAADEMKKRFSKQYGDSPVTEVRWCIHTVSSDCYDPLHQWLSFCHCLIDRHHGIHIIHDTSGICRKVMS